MAERTGNLISVSDETMGSALAVAVTVGAQTLTVDDTIDFSESGGLLRLAGIEYEYDAVDKQANTIHLATPATVAVDVEANVDAMTGPGMQAREWVAYLESIDPDGMPIPATIPVSLVGYFTNADTATPVSYASDGAGGYRVISRPNTEPELDGSVVWNPYVSRRADSMGIQHNTWTPVQNWLDAVHQGLTIESDGSVTVIYPGLYAIDATPAFASNPSGSRGTRIMVNGIQSGYIVIPASSPGTTDVQGFARPLLAVGDNVRIDVLQTSGATLQLAFGIGVSGFSMYRISV